MSTSKQRRRPSTSPTHTESVDKMEIDFLMLADWAETINGKVYIQGGGWDRKLPVPQGRPFSFAIAAGILVPWNSTNQEHTFSLSIETGDGQPIGQPITGGFNMGRPVTALPGQKFRAPIAARIETKITDLGPYRIGLVVDNDVAKYVSFYVVDKL